jgi:hypothetical protein
MDRLLRDELRRKENRDKMELQRREKEFNAYRAKPLSEEKYQKRLKNTTLDVSTIQGLTSAKSSSKKRPFATFYKDQIEFKQKVETNLKLKRDEEEYRDMMMNKMAIVKPCKNSLVIVERLKQQNHTARNISP